MASVKRLIRLIAIPPLVLLILPLALCDRPAERCEFVKIPDSPWVVEHYVRRTCAYLFCDDYVVAKTNGGREVVLLGFKYNTQDLTIEPFGGKGVMISTGHYGRQSIKIDNFEEFVVQWNDARKNFAISQEEENLEKELSFLKTRLPPALSLIMKPYLFSADYGREERIKENLLEIKHYKTPSNIKNSGKFNVIGINTDCYVSP